MMQNILVTLSGDDEFRLWLSMWLGTALHLVFFGLVCADCLRHRREPAATILWMFLAWSLPITGPLLYLYFGVSRIPNKGFKKHASDRALLAERRARENEALPLAYWRAVHEAGHKEPEDTFGRELNAAMDSFLQDYPLLGGNAITPLLDGDEAYPPMLAAIRSATHHIHLQTFIIRHDRIGRQMLDLLAEKAREGVTVRVLYDRFGSTGAMVTGLFRRYRRIPNLSLAGWTQANLFKRQFQINLRNHRKILVVDGQQAFLGGINIGDENITRRGRPPIRDYHFLVQGPSVQELQYSFMHDWYFITNEDPQELLREAYFPRLDPAGPVLARLVNTGPTADMECITDVLFMSITAARKQILVVTPYFVPPQEIVRALRAAALRGVDVRLIVPRDNNHVYAGLAGRSFYEELLRSGVRIFERRPPFMHAKALIVDDAYALIGTANMDARSLKLNYEANLAVYDEAFVNRFKAMVLDDFAQSDEVVLAVWRRRPAWKQRLENLAFLLMPIL